MYYTLLISVNGSQKSFQLSLRFSCRFQRSMEDGMNVVPAFYAAFKCYRKTSIGNIFAVTWRDFLLHNIQIRHD